MCGGVEKEGRRRPFASQCLPAPLRAYTHTHTHTHTHTKMQQQRPSGTGETRAHRYSPSRFRFGHRASTSLRPPVPHRGKPDTSNPTSQVTEKEAGGGGKLAEPEGSWAEVGMGEKGDCRGG